MVIGMLIQQSTITTGLMFPVLIFVSYRFYQREGYDQDVWKYLQAVYGKNAAVCTEMEK